MARPAYTGFQPTARERLKEAFWELLSKNKYSQITIKKLTSLAMVNPNTFYYHYATMDDLALDALNDEKLYEIPIAFRENILSPSNSISFNRALEYIVIGERWKRIRLFVASDSTVLHKHFYDTLEKFWLSLIGVQKEDLSELDYLDFRFILHGAISVIGMQAEEFNLEYIKTLPERPLGQGIIKALENLMLKYQK